MKKILFCIYSLADGGAEKVLVNLVNNLNSSKYEITVMSIIDNGINKKNLKKNIKYKSLFKIPLKGSSIIFKLFPPKLLYKFCIGYEYDIIISYLEGATARIISGCECEKIKKIAWIHTEFTEEKDITIGFRNLKESINSYKKFDKVMCVSQNVKIGFENITNIRNNVHVVYNTNETDQIRKKSKETVNEINFDKNAINICSVGKVIESKGFDRLAHIHKNLKKKNINTNFYILGEGNQKEKIEKFLMTNKLNDSFKFIGYKENPYKYMEKCDIYACASKKEGFSTAVTEALIIGLPVITTNCSGMAELLGENNEYGIIVKNTEKELGEKLENLIVNKKELEYYKLKSLERGNLFSKKNTVKSVEKILDSI